MPLYVYHCAECELEIEERRPYEKADAPLACPICGENVSRMVAVGFALSKNIPQAAANGAAGVYGQMNGRKHRGGCPCCS
jgi:putative FmdB family regulatory protein